MNRAAFAVGEDLKFDVTRVLDVFLDVDGSIGKGAFRLGASRMIALHKSGVIMRHAHAPTATAAGGLDDHGVTDAPCELECVLLVFDRAITTGDDGNTGFAHRFAGRNLVAHRANG